MLLPPPGTISCLFCAGIISVKDGSDYKFTNHMKSIHEVFDNYEILFSLHFLRENEKEYINAAVKKRMNMTIEDDDDPFRLLFKENDLNSGNDGDGFEIIGGKTRTEEINAETQTPETNLVNLRAKIQFLKKENIKIKKDIQQTDVTLGVKDKELEIGRNNDDNKLDSMHIEIEKDNDGTKHSREEFMCENCQKVFKDKHKFKMHIERKNRCYNKDDLVCTKCSKSFKYYVQLKEHNERKFGCDKRIKAPQCEKCKKLFHDKKNYENHMKRKFSCVKTVLQCEKCDKIFKEKRSFEFHIAKKYDCKMENWRVDGELRKTRNR